MFKFLKIKETAKLPVRYGAMWDLALPQDTIIQPGEMKIVGLGFSMRLEDEKGQLLGARIYPRSSTFKNWRVILANSVGVVDPTYSGPQDEWKLMLYYSYSNKEPITIPEGARVAQFDTYQPTYPHEIVIVDELNYPNRGGIGSTGK